MTGIRASELTDVHGPNAAAAVASPGHAVLDGQVAHAAGPQLHLLGGFGLQVGDNAVPLTPSQQRLVALLGLRGGAIHRGYVAGLLWGESSESRAHGSLRSTLWKLHSLSPGVVLISGNSLTLAPDVPVDVRYAADLNEVSVIRRLAC